MSNKGNKRSLANDKLAESRVNDKLSEYRKSERQLLSMIKTLEENLNDFKAVATHTPRQLSITAQNKGRGGGGEATAIVQWSDWHLDEVVKKSTVNGKNEFNPDIAKKRAAALFKNTVRVVDTQRHDVRIENLVLHLGGDFIGGYIHDELQQTNSMSPIEGVLFAKDLLCSGIDYLIEHGNFKTITVITSPGNHGRLTRKMQFANGYAMNLETMLYHSVAGWFENFKQVKFCIEESEVSYLKVYGKVLRFFHGHQIKFAGGIGGVGVPLYKKLHRWNDSTPAYYNFMCDKHTYSTPTPDCQINGSLKGYDAFAEGCGFKYEEPVQSFTLLDSKRGITIKTKILCE